MQVRNRKIYTATVSLVAGTIVFAALLTGLFRLAIELAPGYRQDLARWVSDIAGRPVSIAGIDLSWRGLAPTLDLRGVVLFEPESGIAALRAETLRLGIGIDRVMAGDFRPDRVEMQGLTLLLRRDEQGVWKVRGVDSDMPEQTEDPLETVLAELSRFDRLRFERCTLVVEGVFDTAVAMNVESALAERRGGGFHLKLTAALPPTLGERLELRLRANGDPARMASWQGDWSASVAGLQPQAWLQTWVGRGAGLRASELDLHLEGPVIGGDFSQADIRVEAASVAADSVGAYNQALSLRARLVRTADEWQLGLRHLAMGGERPWESRAGTLSWRPGADEGAYALRADLDRLRLDDIAPWLALVPSESDDWRATVASLRGDIEGIVLRVQREPNAELRYAYRADLVQLVAAHEAVTVDGLSGELSGSELSGRLVFRDEPLRIGLPAQFQQPVPLDSLRGELEWSRADSGWRVNARRVSLATLGAVARADMDLLLSGERAPDLALSVDFSADDATRFKAFLPAVWPDSLNQWLRRAIVAARVPRGELAIRGRMDRFPFQDSDGDEIFRLDIQAADARLDYADGWPAVAAPTAQLRFEGDSMDITASDGRLAGMPVTQASARIRSFGEGLLEIDGQLEGRGEPMYATLRRSPLAKQFDGLTRHTRLRGTVPLDLKLRVPLGDPQSTRAWGEVQLLNASLHYLPLDEPFRAVNGQIRFDGPRFESDGLLGKFHDIGLVGTLKPVETGGAKLAVDFSLRHGSDGPAEARFVPAWLRDRTRGEGRWHAELMLGGDDERSPLRLSSSLAGVRLDLPGRLGKADSEATELVIDVYAPAERELALDLRLGERLGGVVRLQQVDGEWVERATALNIGSAELPAPQAGVRRITGNIGAVNARAVQRLSERWYVQGDALPLAIDELQVERLAWGDYSVSDFRFSHRGREGGSDLVLGGEGARGTIAWDRQGRGELRAVLDRLRLGYQPADDAPAGEPADPNALPTVDLRIADLAVNGTPFGRLDAQTARLEDGQRLAVFSLQGNGLQLNADGQWWRQNARSGAELALRADFRNVDRVLTALGYARSLEADRARITGDFRWSPSEDGVQWAQARGKLNLSVDDGTLRAVEPGAGRVLGLVNFYTLPRRLSFNFKDVLGQGLAFDRISGDFQLAEGQAHTTNLTVDAPSLRMETRGRIGLADRDYDQRVTVYPDVSSGVTLASALLGGPAVGALVLLAQEILDKPLDQATQLSYRLSGSWENPKVTRIGGGDD